MIYYVHNMSFVQCKQIEMNDIYFTNLFMNISEKRYLKYICLLAKGTRRTFQDPFFLSAYETAFINSRIQSNK